MDREKNKDDVYPIEVLSIIESIPSLFSFSPLFSLLLFN